MYFAALSRLLRTEATLELLVLGRAGQARDRALRRLELLLLGGAGERRGGGGAAGDDLGHVVEVAGADLALVLGRGVAVLLGGELGLLQLGVGGHPPLPVVAGELEHRVVERVE